MNLNSGGKKRTKTKKQKKKKKTKKAYEKEVGHFHKTKY